MDAEETLSDPAVAEIVEGFELLEDWAERYRYLIELGRELEPLPETAKVDANLVQGCQSRVWLVASRDEGPSSLLHFQADSDAHIVRGLIALLLRMFSGKNSEQVLAVDAQAVFGQLGLDQHLSQGRSNGLTSMVQRIRKLAGSGWEG